MILKINVYECFPRSHGIYRLDPGERVDYEVPNHPERFEKMPANLDEALHVLSSSTYLCGQLGRPIINGFNYVKKKEWKAYMNHLTQWERDFYLNC